MKKITLNYLKTKALNIGIVISRLLLRFKKWQLQCRYYELDMDMMCTTMTYKEYCEDIALLNAESDRLNGL